MIFVYNMLRIFRVYDVYIKYDHTHDDSHIPSGSIKIPSEPKAFSTVRGY